MEGCDAESQRAHRDEGLCKTELDEVRRGIAAHMITAGVCIYTTNHDSRMLSAIAGRCYVEARAIPVREPGDARSVGSMASLSPAR